MANRNYRTARGITVDIDALRMVNDRVIAVGNMSVNARGDQVDKDGNITKPRSELMKENYKINARLVKDTAKKPVAKQPATPGKAAFLNAESPSAAPPPQAALRGALASAVAAQKLQTIAPAPAEQEPVIPETPNSDTDGFSELLSTTPTNKTLKRI